MRVTVLLFWTLFATICLQDGQQHVGHNDREDWSRTLWRPRGISVLRNTFGLIIWAAIGLTLLCAAIVVSICTQNYGYQTGLWNTYCMSTKYSSQKIICTVPPVWTVSSRSSAQRYPKEPASGDAARDTNLWHAKVETLQSTQLW